MPKRKPLRKNETHEMDEVVVTATSVPTPSKEVPVHVQVITSDEIKNTDAKDVSDVLAKFVPGHFHKYGSDYSSVGPSWI